ncbi:hypothetical protein Hokovirus_3_78 [Hokovirus HKV1]|uniref:Uncharacterized protein n=1 Tax=Hokovirus HKV1 TaxID=1977638 RepID=A0A1V0SGG0_9VIRU|nr:hypothetical protein Hokovirus_3_78 [Hokovirus HKV1]
MNTFNIYKINYGTVYDNKINMSSINNISLDKYLEKIITTQDNLMRELYNGLNLNQDIIGDSVIVYENDKHIYQIFFLPIYAHPNQDNQDNQNNQNNQDNLENQDQLKNYNQLASILANRNNIGNYVYGDAFLICSKIREDYTCEACNFEIDDILNIIKLKLWHKAVFLTCDKKICEFIFNSYPLEQFSEEECKNYQYIEVKILDFEFLLCFQVKPNRNIINHLGSIFLNSHNIYGDVIICLKQENTYLDCSKEFMKDILLYLLQNGIRESLDSKEAIKKNDLHVVNNKYIQFKKYYDKNKNKYCMNCNYNNEMLLSELLFCANCITFYHNIECKNSDIKHSCIKKDKLQDCIKIEQ